MPRLLLYPFYMVICFLSLTCLSLCLKGECDKSYGSDFVFSDHAKELIVGEIFVRVYNEVPTFQLEVRAGWNLFVQTQTIIGMLLYFCWYKWMKKRILWKLWPTEWACSGMFLLEQNKLTRMSLSWRYAAVDGLIPFFYKLVLQTLRSIPGGGDCASWLCFLSILKNSYTSTIQVQNKYRLLSNWCSFLRVC